MFGLIMNGWVKWCWKLCKVGIGLVLILMMVVYWWFFVCVVRLKWWFGWLLVFVWFWVKYKFLYLKLWFLKFCVIGSCCVLLFVIWWNGGFVLVGVVFCFNFWLMIRNWIVGVWLELFIGKVLFVCLKMVVKLVVVIWKWWVMVKKFGLVEILFFNDVMVVGWRFDWVSFLVLYLVWLWCLVVLKLGNLFWFCWLELWRWLYWILVFLLLDLDELL